jgi:hypothetical protein
MALVTWGEREKQIRKENAYPVRIREMKELAQEVIHHICQSISDVADFPTLKKSADALSVQHNDRQMNITLMTPADASHPGPVTDLLLLSVSGTKSGSLTTSYRMAVGDKNTPMTPVEKANFKYHLQQVLKA